MKVLDNIPLNRTNLFAEYVGTPERELLDRVLGNYSTLTRPVRNSSAPVDVTVRFSLLTVKQFVSI